MVVWPMTHVLGSELRSLSRPLSLICDVYSLRGKS